MVKNKFYLIGLFVCMNLPGFSQVLMLEKAYNHLKDNELDKSLKAVEIACKHESTANDPRAWYLKGFIYKELYRVHPDSLSDYRETALQAIVRCIYLDKTHALKDDCKAISSFIYTSYFNDAIQHLNEGDYANALSVFNIFTTDSTDAYHAEALYYSGYASLMQGKRTQAYQFFQQALQAGYQDPLIYDQLSQNYLERQLHAEAVATLEEGRSLFPEDERLQISALNLYMTLQKYKEAEGIAENYLKRHSEDIQVMLVAGTIYEKLFQTDTIARDEYFLKRKNIYLAILKQDPENVLANYNMGITLYNQAVSIINMNDVYSMDIMDFDQLIARCTNLFKEALPYVKKANELSPDNINTLKALEGIYYNLNDREKFALVREKLEVLKN
jgi:TolA-binding protein